MFLFMDTCSLELSSHILRNLTSEIISSLSCINFFLSVLVSPKFKKKREREREEGRKGGKEERRRGREEGRREGGKERGRKERRKEGKEGEREEERERGREGRKVVPPLVLHFPPATIHFCVIHYG